MIKRKNVLIFGFLIMCFILIGCVSSGVRVSEIYPAPNLEPEWIRNAEPVEFENELWHPVDDLENLLDEEMLPIGVFRSVQFFVEKKDIKPYERLYTKFGKHKYRVFERNTQR
jgi:hypothetical protein